MSLSTQNKRKAGTRQRIFELTLFAMLGTLMFCSKLIMELLPNIHLLGMLIMSITVVFRAKALIPIYIYVILNGIYAGFALWWIPYLYVWTLLWCFTMLFPKNMSKKVSAIAYPIVCALHGFMFGILYAPAQALMYGFNFDQMLVWIAGGSVFDIIHGISNFFTGMLILPLSELIKKLLQTRGLTL